MAKEKFNEKELLEAIEKYTEATDQPLIKEFCLQFDISEDALQDYRDKYRSISGAIKKLLAKQEVFLVKAGSSNQINPTMAIFRLKQPVFGYTDKQQVDFTGNVSFTGENDLKD